MKRDRILLFLIVPVFAFYLLSHFFNKKELSKMPQLTMEDSFEKLLGKETPDWKHMVAERDYTNLEFYKQVYLSKKNLQFKAPSSFKIPKIVHFIWLGPRPFPSESVENIRTWIAHHPDWHFYFWTDHERMPPCNHLEMRDIKDFKFKYLEKKFYASKNMGEKSDLLRYEILYQKGGVYVDHDVKCLKPFHNLHAAYDFYAGLEMPHTGVEERALTVAIGIIGIKPYHPLMKKVIEIVTERWEEVTRRFASDDLLSQARLVSHRSYISLTLALENNLSLWEDGGIVFPASYFYPKHGLVGFYTHHFYATTWNNLKENHKEKFIRKTLNRSLKSSMKMIRIEMVSLIVLFGCFILVFLMNLKISRGFNKK